MIMDGHSRAAGIGLHNWFWRTWRAYVNHKLMTKTHEVTATGLYQQNQEIILSANLVRLPRTQVGQCVPCIQRTLEL